MFCPPNFAPPQCTQCIQGWTGTQCSSCDFGLAGEDCKTCGTSVVWSGNYVGYTSPKDLFTMNLSFSGSDCATFQGISQVNTRCCLRQLMQINTL